MLMPTPQCKATSQRVCMPGLGGAEAVCVTKGKSLNLSMALASPDQSTEDKGRQDVKVLKNQKIRTPRTGGLGGNVVMLSLDKFFKIYYIKADVRQPDMRIKMSFTSLDLRNPFASCNNFKHVTSSPLASLYELTHNNNNNNGCIN